MTMTTANDVASATGYGLLKAKKEDRGRVSDEYKEATNKDEDNRVEEWHPFTQLVVPAWRSELPS